GRLGGATQDGSGSFAAGDHEDYPMVSAPPASSDRRATSGTETEVAGTLCVLWDHRQLPSVAAILVPGPSALAKVALPPWARELPSVAPVHRAAAALPAAAAGGGAFSVPARSAPRVTSRMP